MKTFRDTARRPHARNASCGLVLILLGVQIVLQSGCSREEETAPQPNMASRTNLMIGSTNAELQAELDRVIKVQTDPSKRPLILSEPAANRRQWALQALLQGYRDTGRTNARWDQPVGGAFEAYADLTRAGGTNWAAMRSVLAAVVATGCDDPMIQYMRARYSEEPRTEVESAIQLSQAHRAMMQSHHHPVFKFFAGWRATAAQRDADPHARNPQIMWTTVSLEDLARDTNAPIDEVFEAARNWLEMSQGKMWMDSVLHGVDPILQRNWNNTEQLYHLEGYVEVWRAWGERGGGWASGVTQKGWEGFAEHLTKAEELLTKAWQMNSNNADTAYQMMQLELGQGRGRARMELWFNRAMSLQSDYFDAAKLMSFYLEPRWYGSDRATLEFARSCVASDKWNGRVPLILANVHHSLATYYKLDRSPEYWQRPEVWADVKSSYEKFFSLNSDTESWRHDYARDAYDCGQYAVFLDQTKLFTSGTNFTFFGGRDKFQEMLRTAAAAAGKPSP